MGTRFFAYSHRMSFPTRVRLKGSPEVTNYFLFADHLEGGQASQCTRVVGSNPPMQP